MTAVAKRLPDARSLVHGVDFSGDRAAGRKIWISRGMVCGERLRIDQCCRADEPLGVREERDGMPWTVWRRRGPSSGHCADQKRWQVRSTPGTRLKDTYLPDGPGR